MSRRIASDFLYTDSGHYNFLASKKDDEISDYRMRILKSALKELVSEGLTEKQRIYVTLYFYDELTMAQIAEICGVNKSTVSRLIKRAKHKIERQIRYITPQ